jgi:2-phosphoglycerate kinase
MPGLTTSHFLKAGSHGVYKIMSKIYLIGGLSGTGKSTIYHELIRRGYNAVEADDELAYFAHPETRQPVDEKTELWLWDEDKFLEAIKRGSDNEPIFVCGGATNEKDFERHFDKIFTLYINDEVLKHRIATRTNNDYGREPKELEKLLEWNKGAIDYAKKRGATLIDATRPLNEVVDEILRYVKEDK